MSAWRGRRHGPAGGRRVGGRWADGGGRVRDLCLGGGERGGARGGRGRGHRGASIRGGSEVRPEPRLHHCCGRRSNSIHPGGPTSSSADSSVPRRAQNKSALPTTRHQSLREPPSAPTPPRREREQGPRGCLPGRQRLLRRIAAASQMPPPPPPPPPPPRLGRASAGRPLSGTRSRSPSAGRITTAALC